MFPTGPFDFDPNRILFRSSEWTGRPTPLTTGIESANREALPAVNLDVFIGYNAQDLTEVHAVVNAIEQFGVRAWLDARDLPPGRMFQDVIQGVLQSCGSVAMFIGAHGMGPWEALEMKLAISEFVRRGLPVIPVVLPSVREPRLPLYLSEFRMVRLRPGAGLAAGVEELVWGITGTRPGPRPDADDYSMRSST